MTDASVAISQEEIKTGILAATEAFLGQSEEYLAITPALYQGLIEGGKVEALYAPAVKFIVDATLGILTQPEIGERIPREVAGRRRVAVHFGNYVVQVAVNSDMFRHFYEHNPDLAPIAKPILKELTDPDDVKYIASLGLAPFFDTSLVSGGALGFLRKRGIAGTDPGSIIARSRGLLAISGIEKGNSGTVVKYLGAPYAAKDHFQIAPNKEELAVAFTDETRMFLRILSSGDGCPSGHLPTAHDPNMTVLEDSWQRIVSYLVPPGATVQETSS